MHRVLSVVALTIVLAAAEEIEAQQVRGVVVDRDGTPVPGVVVQLVDSASNVVARALSSEQGRYSVGASVSGNYRLRAFRIGFRPTIDSIEVQVGKAVDHRLLLRGLSITLDTVRVTTRSVCATAGNLETTAFSLWEQARTALNATELTASQRNLFVRTISYEQTLATDGMRAQRRSSNVFSGYVTRPWLTLPADSLRKLGYVVTVDGQSTMYYGPGLDMLISAAFVEDHCFRVVESGDAIGVAFTPTNERKHVAEIKGTAWLERSTSQLRTVDFEYVNRELDARLAGGGEIKFAKLSNAMWVIARWTLRMPVIERRVRSQAYGGIDTRLTATQIVGGQLVLVRRGDDTLWAGPAVTVLGHVSDSLSGAAVGSARVRLVGTSLRAETDRRGHFTMPGVLPGEYSVEVNTRSLDSVNAVHRSNVLLIDSAAVIQLRVPDARLVVQSMCGTLQRESGVVWGRVSLQGDSLALRSAIVTAEWIDPANASADTSSSGSQHRWIDARIDANGAFRVCGVPVSTSIALHARSETASTPAPVALTIPASTRFGRVNLELQSLAAAAAQSVFTGLVVADSSRRPVPGAEVTLADVGRRAFTNDAGGFRIADIPPGIHHLVVRHIGYGVVETDLNFRPSAVVDRRIVLGRAILLDSVMIVERQVDRAMASFEEHRRTGLGNFLTRDQLSKMENRTTASVLEQIPGLRIAQGRTRQAWIMSGRPRTRSVKPDTSDVIRGARQGCYAQVYLDRVRVYSGRDDEPLFDVNSIAPDQIEAIEYYASPAQTPMEYAALNSTCGVLVIWTRRTY